MPIRRACASSTRAYPTCRSRPRRRLLRSCSGSSHRGSNDSAWPSGRPSPARTCRAWCRHSTRSPIGSPTSPWCWPARRGGGAGTGLGGRRVAGAPEDRPHGLGGAGRSGGAAVAGECAGLPLALRGVRVPAVAGHARRGARGLHASRFVARGARGRRPVGRRRRSRRRWPRRWPPAWATRGSARARLLLAGPGRRAYSWERCGDGLEALYRDAAASRG